MNAEEYKKVRAILYTGTIESYNEFVDNMGDDPMRPYLFLDEKCHSTWKFTGIIGTMEGMIYRPGDYYQVDIIDD